MRATVEQLGSLRATDPILYGYVLPVAKGVDGTTVEIDVSKIDKLHAKLLEIWAKENNIQQEPPQHDPKCQGECGRNECFQKHTAEIAESERKRLEPLNAAIARLQEYFAAGLVDSPENAAIFDRTWREHPQLSKITTSSPDIVDVVIALCRDKLAWRKPGPTPAATPEPATVRTLPNGEPELALDADEAKMRRASITQLRDLSKRRGEGKSWFNKAGRSAGNIDTGNQWQVR